MQQTPHLVEYSEHWHRKRAANC